MANPVKGELAFETEAGETFTLLYSYDALVVMEDARDMPYEQIVDQLKKGRLGAIRVMFWAGLRANHPRLTQAQAGELIRQVPGKGPRVQELVIEALLLAFPEAREAEEAAPHPRTARGASG